MALMKKLLAVLLLLICANVQAQIGVGQWRLHIPANQTSDVVSCNNLIYTAYENGLSEYDPESNELSTWDIVSGLSDITISSLGTNGSDVFVGYENGNLDVIRNNGVINIPAIKLAQIQGMKRINRIVSYGSYVYLATGFGIVKIDPAKEEVRDSYYPSNGLGEIIDISFRNDSIFALGTDRLYVGSLNNPALVDPAQWTVDPRVPILSSNAYNFIETVGEELFISLAVDGYGLDTVYRIRSTDLDIPFLESFAMEVSDIREVEGKLLVCYFDGFVQYDNTFTPTAVLYDYGFSLPTPRTACRLNGYFYVADNFHGLVKFSNSGGERLSISGPPRNSFYQLDWQNGRLLVAGGGMSGINKTYNSSGVYIFEDESWTHYSNGTVSKWNEVQNDVLVVAGEKGGGDKFAVGALSTIPLTVFNGDAVDTFTTYNSNLEFTNGSSVFSMISGMEYDDDGNLWTLSGFGTKPLRVLTKEGQWYEFGIGSGGINQFSRKLIIDYQGNKWFTFRNQGLYGYKDNGTPSNPADDDYIQLTVGEASGDLPSSEVTAIAVDFDNEIWIGTDNGFAVLYNSDGAFDAAPGGFNAQRIKVDFEGNVEYVLGSTHITDIEVDGGNRKWMATENSGLILLSPDGLEILQHFTTDNSPLISNAIIDIEIDHKTGEVFIITDKGLISYRSDASYEDPDYTDVQVFPNPARPDFDGPITIQGIRYDSDVKITDVAGNLVFQTTSNGGTATWNGRRLSGEKVSTGVYLIWTAPNEGKGRYVGKVLVVN